MVHRARQGIDPDSGYVPAYDVALAEANAALLGFLDQVNATLDSHTQLVRLRLVPVTTDAAFKQWLQTYIESEELWSYVTVVNDDGSRVAMAVPTTDIGPQTTQLFAFTEIHQLMVVWWLTAAWRARQFLSAAETLTTSGLIVAAAACVRGLVETAAQFRADALKIVNAWNDLKRDADPASIGQTGFRGRNALLLVLLEAVQGGKFDEKVPDLQAAYGRTKRSNVLTAVEKLTRTYGVT